MGQLAELKSVSVATIASAGDASEKIIATLPPLEPAGPGRKLIIIASFGVTVGTNGVTLITRLRQGTTVTGTLIRATPAVTVVAASVFSVSIAAELVLGDVSDVQCVLTEQIASESGASTFAGIELVGMIQYP